VKAIAFDAYGADHTVRAITDLPALLGG